MTLLSYDRPVTQQPPAVLLMPDKRMRTKIIAGSINCIVVMGRIDYRLSGIPIVLCHQKEQWRLFADLSGVCQKQLCELTKKECSRADFANWREVASQLFGEKDPYLDEEKKAIITLVRFQNVRESLGD